MSPGHVVEIRELHHWRPVAEPRAREDAEAVGLALARTYRVVRVRPRDRRLALAAWRDGRRVVPRPRIRKPWRARLDVT